MPNKPNSAQVSYMDVQKAADEVEKAHGCHIHFQWFMGNQNGGNWKWSLRIVALWKGKGSAIIHERGRSLSWPNVDHRTPAGAMLALVYELDYQLTEEEERAGQAELGQLRFA